MAVNSDYDLSGFLNQNRLNTVNSLLGANRKIGGMDTDAIQQLSMLRSNSTAYRRLLEAEKTGTIRQNQNYKELMSDRFFNENYNPKTGALVKPVYSPKATATPSIDVAADTGLTLDNMRRLALAAAGNSSALGTVHYDLFEHMRQTLASNLVGPSPAAAGDEAGGEVVASAGGNAGDGAITSVSDLGKVEMNGRTYSFADLVRGGAASPTASPEAALAVLDQTIRDIYGGAAKIRGFDPASSPMLIP